MTALGGSDMGSSDLHERLYNLASFFDTELLNLEL
jgi:hypothetical protein